MARIVGLLALRFANADVFPFEPSAYGREIARYAGDFAATPAGRAGAPELARLVQHALAWSRASSSAEQSIATRLRAAATEAIWRRENRWLLSAERLLLDDRGLPGRPWFRHLVYAPLPSYAAETLPAIREAFQAGNARQAVAEVHRLERKLAAETAEAKRFLPAASRSR